MSNNIIFHYEFEKLLNTLSQSMFEVCTNFSLGWDNVQSSLTAVTRASRHRDVLRNLATFVNAALFAGRLNAVVLMVNARIHVEVFP